LFFFRFLLGYIHCTGGIHCDNSEQPYIIHWLDCPTMYSSSPSSSHCKRFHHSISYMYMKSINHIPSLHLFHLPSPLPQVLLHTHTVPILQSCPSLFIPKSVLKLVSQFIPAVSVVFFGLLNSFHCSLLPLPSPTSPPLFNSFQYISCKVFQCC
jgi:hypothetical protein